MGYAEQISSFVYIVASENETLYIGVTDNLERRIYKLRNVLLEGFSKKYHCHELIYFEEYNEIIEAITGEKQLKNWNRNKKERLIRKMYLVVKI